MSVGFEIVILLVAVVVLMYFLINTLGTRDGFEPEQKPAAKSEPVDSGRQDAPSDEDEIALYAQDNPRVANALRQAKLVEPGFRVADFLKGAKYAYEQIVIGFLAGDVENFKPFIADEIYLGFQEAIDDRRANGQKIDASFVGFQNVAITDAYFDAAERELTLTVDFTAQLTRQVSDAEGNVIEGSKTKAETELGTWQFARIMGSNDPNWTLISTGA